MYNVTQDWNIRKLYTTLYELTFICRKKGGVNYIYLKKGRWDDLIDDLAFLWKSAISRLSKLH